MAAEKEMRSAPPQKSWLRIRSSPSSRLEVDRGPEASVHVEGDGAVLVHDHPLTGDLAEAHGRTQPDVRRLAARPLTGEPVQAVTERHLVAGGDGEIPDLVADRPVPGRKPLCQAFCDGVAPML